MKKSPLARAAAPLCACALFVSIGSAQVGQRFPSEKKLVIDPVTGTPLSFLTSSDAGDSKIYQTHPVPALGRALSKLNLGTVDLKHLAQKHGESEFLGSLLESEVKDSGGAHDAVIFAGPKVMLDDGLSPETLKQLGEVKVPVFYMNYNLYPLANPWRDAIGSAVRASRGIEYTISRPRDLFFAWSEIMGRIVKLKVGRTGSGNSSSQ